LTPLHGVLLGHSSFGISGTGPLVGPPALNRSPPPVSRWYWSCAEVVLVRSRRGSGGASTDPVIVVLAGYAVAVRVQVVRVARVSFELCLSRLLRAEAGAVVLVFLCYG
jgi:hypothetical protein